MRRESRLEQFQSFFLPGSEKMHGWHDVESQIQDFKSCSKQSHFPSSGLTPASRPSCSCFAKSAKLPEDKLKPGIFFRITQLGKVLTHPKVGEQHNWMSVKVYNRGSSKPIWKRLHFTLPGFGGSKTLFGNLQVKYLESSPKFVFQPLILDLFVSSCESCFLLSSSEGEGNNTNPW